MFLKCCPLLCVYSMCVCVCVRARARVCVQTGMQSSQNVSSWSGLKGWQGFTVCLDFKCLPVVASLFLQHDKTPPASIHSLHLFGSGVSVPRSPPPSGIILSLRPPDSLCTSHLLLLLFLLFLCSKNRHSAPSGYLPLLLVFSCLLLLLTWTANGPPGGRASQTECQNLAPWGERLA